jgi:hypothetical protein
LPKTGNCFKAFAKVSSCVGGPDRRKLIFDEHFLLTMTEVEREA